MTDTATRLVVLVPAVAALLGLLLARRADVRVPRAVAITTSAAGIVVALLEVLGVHGSSGGGTLSTVPALAAGELRIPLQLQATTATATIALVVAVVGWAVQVFAGWYLRDDDRYGVFAATVSLFTAGMLLTVQSADLVLTLVGWEVMGWCSYLLIGHWSRKESAGRAALKAFLVTRLADVGFVLGVVILAAGAGSTAYRQVLQSWASTGCDDAGACAAPNGGLLNAAMVLLVIGVLGKSGMVPFHDWLPDAMEGPTPASALIHAATMVAAGTFVLAQLFDVLAAADGARWLLAVSTAVTMVYAAVLAFGQSDLKRLLAYSTLSQVALMLSALAVAPADEGPGAGVLHLYSHAFFKALLFLAIGWLSVTVGGTAAATMRGGLRGHLFIRPAMFVGLLSLAGVPPLVGFVSKEHVLAAAEAGTGDGAARAWLVLLAGLLTVVLTAAYCMRAWLVLDDLSAAEIQRHDTDSASLGVRTVVMVLAFLTVVGGLVVFTPLLDVGGRIGWLVAVLSILLIVGAGLAVRSVAQGEDAAARVVGQRMPAFDAGLGVDRLYVSLVAQPVLALARLVVFLDREVVDAYVRGAATAARLGGTGGQRVHRSEVAASGLAWVVAGVVAVALAGVALW
ncbi:NADH-quinone oxidoreductase subunit L [Pedococcus dokdonensis]|uniref:NADH-quinone oxidoreductase subunit L n=1 Tax=Pedococcus dokdonensis TaxID=443156 RepID=A0A1H0V3I8_9MICO|nr:proton-conducting transporter membrane subunit [Pedococcus dokdonensis]SDP73099.1 NADH-quinone oxidoreductase subunit L [Pedococcus dokdonensis]